MSHYQPHPAYKDSGVEWIGRVPAHWDLVPMKIVSRIFNGATPKSSEEAYWGGEIAWYTPSDLDSENATRLGEPSRFLTRSGLASCAARLAPVGSVVLSIRAPVGSIGITDRPATTNQGCRTLVPIEGLSPEYLASLLVAARQELSVRANGTTFQELSGQALASIKVPLPSSTESQSILSAVQRETTRIDTLIEKTKQSIDLLKERRSTLITAAVTGQIDLREAP